MVVRHKPVVSTATVADDYHDVLHALRKKPMALFNLVYRDQLRNPSQGGH